MKDTALEYYGLIGQEGRKTHQPYLCAIVSDIFLVRLL